MYGILLIEKIPLFDKNMIYTSLTCDGKCIYILSKTQKALAIYDTDVNFIKYIHVKKKYYDICYDGNDFWAVCGDSNIYKLHRDTFYEIDKIEVDKSKNLKLSNISAARGHSGFTVSNDIYTYNCGRNGGIYEQICSNINEFNTAIVNYNENIIKTSSYLKSNISIIKNINEKKELEFLTCLPKEHRAQSSTLFNNYLMILTQKNFKYPHILKYLICNVDVFSQDDNFIEINSN